MKTIWVFFVGGGMFWPVDGQRIRIEEDQRRKVGGRGEKYVVVVSFEGRVFGSFITKGVRFS